MYTVQILCIGTDRSHLVLFIALLPQGKIQQIRWIPQQEFQITSHSHTNKRMN